MDSPSLTVALIIILAIIPGIHGVSFIVVNQVEETEAGKDFNSLIGDQSSGKKLMKQAANYIWANFEQWTGYDRKPVKKVTLYIDENDKDSTYNINGEDYEIHISAKRLIKSGKVGESQARQAFKELVYYEMTHVLQWTGTGKDGMRQVLKDGIAAFMVLKVGYEPKGWAIKGEGESWDERYDVTARFLEYCQESSSIDFIAKLNKRLKDSYSEQIFDDLLGKGIDKLWSGYKTKYKTDDQKNA